MLPVSQSAFEVTLSSVEGWVVEWAWEEVMEWAEFRAWPWLLGDEPLDQHHALQAPPLQFPLLSSVGDKRERERERERKRERRSERERREIY